MLNYDHESWVMTERVRSQVRASEMRFLRRIEGVTLFKGGESSSQLRCFTIAKTELEFLIFYVSILGKLLHRYSTNTKRYPPTKSFWKL